LRQRRVLDPCEVLKRVPGVKVKVTFEDGEVIFGTTLVYGRQRSSFFIRPADLDSNNERLFVYTDSTAKVETWM
jgi:hypothetical protein